VEPDWSGVWAVADPERSDFPVAHSLSLSEALRTSLMSQPGFSFTSLATAISPVTLQRDHLMCRVESDPKDLATMILLATLVFDTGFRRP
jgi:hypothetical protein